MSSDEVPVNVTTALQASHILWPNFVREHGCIFLSRHSGSNPPPRNDTHTNWKSFVNHTHIFDEFANEATTVIKSEEFEELVFVEETYNAQHADFIAACELGRRVAELWAIKLSIDFPMERFRVYYTQYDNPVVRFHKVREDEPHWLSDEQLRITVDPVFENAVIHDTARAQLSSGEGSNTPQ